tara:strand:+ start:3237 stop:3701 length:465 start_codon:yes stop_codon:yes gene_type:complete
MLGIISFSACEKDDICVDGNTPLLVIGFYDVTDTSLVKPVPLLVVKGLDGGDTLAVITNKSLESIELPLRPETDNTTFVLSQNPTTEASTLNEDVITFNYESKEVFISRACGFVANYDNLSGTVGADALNWILAIEVKTTLVANSNETHVKIYH